MLSKDQNLKRYFQNNWFEDNDDRVKHRWIQQLLFKEGMDETSTRSPGGVKKAREAWARGQVRKWKSTSSVGLSKRDLQSSDHSFIACTSSLLHGCWLDTGRLFLLLKICFFKHAAVPKTGRKVKADVVKKFQKAMSQWLLTECTHQLLDVVACENQFSQIWQRLFQILPYTTVQTLHTIKTQEMCIGWQIYWDKNCLIQIFFNITKKTFVPMTPSDWTLNNIKSDVAVEAEIDIVILKRRAKIATYSNLVSALLNVLSYWGGISLDLHSQAMKCCRAKLTKSCCCSLTRFSVF